MKIRQTQRSIKKPGLLLILWHKKSPIVILHDPQLKPTSPTPERSTFIANSWSVSEVSVDRLNGRNGVAELLQLQNNEFGVVVTTIHD